VTDQTPSAVRGPENAERLGRTFLRSLTAADLVESLLSLDENQPAAMGLDLLRETREAVLGVRRSGAIAGWVQSGDLVGGTIGMHAREICREDMIEETASLDVVLAMLTSRDHIFVRWLGKVTGVIVKRDLQKAPMRMWLFGAITVLDVNMTWAIEKLHSENSWQKFLSQGRLEKALALQTERQRRGGECRLVDCLQLKDKGDILLRDRRLLAVLGLTSQRQADRFTRDIEFLRNHLAHTQELESEHLLTGARLATFIESIVHAKGVRQIVASSHNPDTPSL
jgi:hypothetical protein